MLKGWKAWLAGVALAGVAAGAGFVLITEVFDAGNDSPPADSGEGPAGSDRGPLVIRALGDSVTAGFGYSDVDGTKISVGELPRCASRPADPNCQDPDGVAYPARFAARHGGSDFKNLAVSGSIPADYLGEGKLDLRSDLKAVTKADPDVTVVTIGANPLLRSFLLRSDRHCASGSEAAARRCVEAALLREQVLPRLTRIYTALLDTPSDGRNGQVIVFQYPEIHPPSAFGVRLKVLIEELRSTIEGAAAAARAADPNAGQRLVVADPGPFLQHGCVSAVPWILRVDTCIHPNIAGHVQLANVLDGLLRK